MTCSLSAVALELPRSVHHVCCALRRSTHFFRWCAMVCVCALAPVPGSRPRVLVKPPLLRADVPHVSIAPCPRWKCRTVAQVPTRAVRHPWRPQHRGGRARSQPLSRGRTCSYRDMQIAYIQNAIKHALGSLGVYLESPLSGKSGFPRPPRASVPGHGPCGNFTFRGGVCVQCSHFPGSKRHTS